MSQIVDEPVRIHDADHLQYRALSMLAVATLVLAVLSLSALVMPILLVIPALGIFLGAIAIFKIKRNSDQLSGMGIAHVGFFSCVALLLGGSVFHSYIYATEVPDGYERISFQVLQPSDPRFPVPESAVELDGKQVFIKGYVHPSSGNGARENLKQFVLVPDMGTCCFGEQPKLTDMIEVTLQDPHRVNYSFARRKLAGTLKVSTQKKPVSGLDGVYYQLDAFVVK